eukprot:EG_transcript_13771
MGPPAAPGGGSPTEALPYVDVQAGLEAEQTRLSEEAERREAELQRRHDDEVRRVMQTPPPCMQTKPRGIAGPNDAADHARWKEQEFARIARELEESRLVARRELKTQAEEAARKWRSIALDQEARLGELLGQTSGGAPEQGEEYWKARCETLELMCRDMHSELQSLRQRTQFLETRRLSTLGHWTYRSCPADHPSLLTEHLNRVQPTPDSIMGCVALPSIHVWIRQEGEPSGLRYAVRRTPWTMDEATRLLHRGDVVVLGVTLGQELFYLQIENPTFPPPPPPVAPPPLHHFAWEDVSGVLFREEHLQAEFDRLGKDADETIDCRQFMDLYGRLFLRGLVEPDPGLEGLFAKYGIRPDGRMNFDEFCVLMLTVAKR